MNISHLRSLRSLAALCLVGAGAALGAQALSATGVGALPRASLDAQDVQEVARRVGPPNVVSERLDAVEDEMRRSADEMAVIRQMLADQQALIEMNGQLLRQLSRSGAARDARRAELEAREDEVRKTIAQAGDDVAAELDAILQDLRDRPLEEESDPKSVEDRARETRDRFAQADADLRRQREDNAKRFAQHCDAAPIEAVAAHGLKPLVSGPLPPHWTPLLIDLAVMHGVALPACLTEAGDGALEKDMRAQPRNEQALEETRDYVFDSLAYFVVQVFTFPARVIVKFWQCLWGLPSCEPRSGGGGDGEGSKDGGGRQDGGGTIGHVPPAGHSALVGGDPDKSGTPKPQSDDDQGDPDAAADGTVAEQPEHAAPPVLRQHENIEPGVDVALEVRGHLLTFTDLKDKTQKWYTEWPPNSDGFLSQPLPGFSEAIRIISANVAERRLVVDIESIECGSEQPGRLTLEADPKPRVEGGMIVKRVSPDCVW